MDWQVGDLALCVDDSPNRSAGHNGGLKKDKVYRVSDLALFPEGIGLRLYGLPEPKGCLSGYFNGQRFRKIKPDTEPCEEEFTVLIKRMKPAKVGA